MTTLAFVFGAFFGAAIGIGIMALIVVSKQADRMADVIHRWEAEDARHQPGSGLSRD